MFFPFGKVFNLIIEKKIIFFMAKKILYNSSFTHRAVITWL